MDEETKTEVEVSGAEEVTETEEAAPVEKSVQEEASA